jgi:HlyD family secretion protein
MITNSWVNAGDVVNPNTSAFHLEDRSHIFVDVSISEVDVNRIKIGQDAVLTFDSVYGKEYHGKVSKIGTTGVVSSGVVNFPITVELTDADDAIKTAMTSTITITVEQIKDALLVPNKAVRTLEGKRIVFIMRDKLPVQVEVKLGTSSETSSEVLSGDIKEGDLVVTNPDMLVQSAQGGMMVR